MKIKELCEAKTVNEANKLISVGWELIAPISLPHAVVYVMGKREEAPAPDKKK